MRIRTAADALAAAARFRERACCESVLITRGEHGMTLLGPDGESELAAEAREVSDVTGAGDTVIATMTLALAAGASLVEAAKLANRAAGIVVGKFGPATVSVSELAGN
jgi:D-beta-D-heptose 7-phosphate kinase/D-beta-D-heptose 1-phosphate adenosyltransferase